MSGSINFCTISGLKSITGRTAVSYSALICKSIKALLLAGYCSLFWESVYSFISQPSLSCASLSVSLSHRLAFPISRAQSCSGLPHPTLSWLTFIWLLQHRTKGQVANHPRYIYLLRVIITEHVCDISLPESFVYAYYSMYLTILGIYPTFILVCYLGMIFLRAYIL